MEGARELRVRANVWPGSHGDYPFADDHRPMPAGPVGHRRSTVAPTSTGRPSSRADLAVPNQVCGIMVEW